MKRLSLVAGLAVLGLIWLGPLLSAWRDSFSAHMLAHMGVVAVAAPLIAFGLGSFNLPFKRQEWREGPDSAASALVSLPIIASLVELIVVWGWHAPVARRWVEGSLVATMLEQGSFLIAGLLLWGACLTAGASVSSAHRGAGAFGLLLTTVHMTLLGALLALSPRPLYGTGEVTCFGLTLEAAQDQQIGAVIMLFVGAAVYLAGGVSLTARLLSESSRRLV